MYEYFFSEKKLKEKPLLYANYLANITKIIESIRTYKKNSHRLKLEDFAEFIAIIENYEVELTTSTHIGSANAVQCITGHKSK